MANPAMPGLVTYVRLKIVESLKAAICGLSDSFYNQQTVVRLAQHGLRQD